MSTILTSAALVALIGLIAGLVLTTFSAIMSVPKDEKVEKIIGVLPGANCGACGYSGCEGYARALVSSGERTNLCAPGGEKVSNEISKVLGVRGASLEKKVAVVSCLGNCYNTQSKMKYQGIDSCLAASQVCGGTSECNFGCVGFGDCVRVCKFGAISICDGIAIIDRNKCKGCNLCIAECPKGLIKMHKDDRKAFVYCSNKDKGAKTRKACTVGCIGCMRCVKECKEGAIKVIDNLAIIDREKCTGCGKCTEVCKPGCIHI